MQENGDDPLVGRMVGSYRVAALLGAGGFGHVYKGVHPDIGSRVAIKVLSHDAASRRNLVERFFAEARAVNHIRHENIVNVLDLARLEDGRPYILMELLEGSSLGELIRRHGRLPIGEVVRVTQQVLAALAAAHAAGVVHRDIKPDNVFVSQNGQVKVLDFGIAKLKPEIAGASPATATGSVLGTPHYMAPEQIVGLPVDGRSDLYAVGAVMFEALSGRPPFDAPTLYALLRKHVEEPPPSLRAERRDVPESLERAVMRALAKDPKARAADATEMARQLGEGIDITTPEWIAAGPTVPDPEAAPAAPTQQQSAVHTIQPLEPPGTIAIPPAQQPAWQPPPVWQPPPPAWAPPTPPAFAGPGTPLGPIMTPVSPSPKRIGNRILALALVAAGLFGVLVTAGVVTRMRERPAKVKEKKRTVSDETSETTEELEDDIENPSLRELGLIGEPLDLSEWVARGYQQARDRVPDAELVKIEALSVDAEGMAKHGIFTSFASPKDGRCVQVMPNMTAVVPGEVCQGATVRMPVCKVKAVMRAARKRADESESARAGLSYPTDGRPVWTVQFGVGKPVRVKDDCD